VKRQEKEQVPHSQNISIESGHKDNRKPNKPKECSDKTPFKSKYKEGYITPSNFLAEMIFEKRNEFFNSGKCPERFWITGNKLHGAYKGQVIAASRLLKKYNADSIIKALKSEDAKFIFKLQDKKLEPIIKKFEDTRVDKKLMQSYNESEEISKPFRSGKKNILKDL
jgi:hypothetical protein